MANAQQVLRDGIARFIESAQEHTDTKFDGSLKSLIGVAAVLQQYHEWYLRGRDANDADHEKFASTMAFWATCYVGDVLTRQFKGQWSAIEGNVAITVAGAEFPLSSLMLDEIKNGKKHSILLPRKIGALLMESAPKPEMTADQQLGPKMQLLAQAALKDVKAMLKMDLDFSPPSLAIIDQALARVKSLAEMSPEHRQQMAAASCDKYGAYIGEVLLKQTNGKWMYVKRGDETYKAVEFGHTCAMPELIVRAILEGKSLNMGKGAASSVVEFFQLCRQREADTRLRRETTPQYIIDNLDMFAQAVVEAAAGMGLSLDFTLFSLPVLDQAIERQRDIFRRAAGNETETEIHERLALSAIGYGVYLGETLRRVHGGVWEKNASDPEGLAPRIRHRRYLLDPIASCASLLRGQPVRIAAGQVTMVQHFYQEARPMFQDAMTQRLLGGAQDYPALLASLGPNEELNHEVLEFAESCVLETHGKYGVVLDFSEDSLRNVDDILQKIHAMPEERKNNSNYDPLNLIYWYGYYSGEVFRRVLGGTWNNSPINDPPQNVPRLEVEGAKIFVLGKVQKALRDPLGDSIAFMLHATKGILEDQRKNAAAGVQNP